MTIEKRIQALLNASPAQLAEIDRALNGNIGNENSVDRIIRRNEAARLLARSPRAVDYLSAAGHLEKVTLPGHSRAAGFRLSDVQSLIGG